MSFSRAGFPAFAAILILLTSASCTRRSNSPAATPRIAILRFENLGSNPSDDWIGRALADVMTETLANDPALNVIPSVRLQASNLALGMRPVSAPGVSAGRPPALAAGATRLAYGEYAVRGNRLEATMTVEDAQTGKITEVASSSGAANGIFVVAAALASRISTHAGTYPTQNPAALRGWIDAQETSDPPAVERSLEQAIAADAGFAPPYRALAEIRARRRDVPGAVSLLESALAVRPSLPPADRARIEAELAALRNDPAARDRALAELAKLTPADPGVRRTQIAATLARHDYAKGEELLRALAALEPEDANTWKQLGYTAAWAGDLNTAMEALRRYQSLRPAESDPLDSQGDVNLILGQLREAENLYLEASKKDPNFLGSLDLFKAAYARLVSGDIAGADGLFARYVQVRVAAKDPLLPYRQAEWDWVAGRRKPAIARLEEIARASESGAGREQASRAYTELALWHLALGDRETAASMGGRAIAASLPANGASAYFARFLAQPDTSPAEWETRAGRFFQNPAVSQLKQFALACALLYGKHFEAAVPVVQQVEQAGSIANDPILPVLRAWTLVETGHPSEAAPFLRWNPAPPPTGFGGFWTLGFPRIFYLRAALAASQGKPDEAKALYRLFLQLSGPDPLQWGEEKQAKAAM